MAIEYWRTQVSFPHDSGLPENAVTNTWHWIKPDELAAGTGFTGLHTMLTGFYSEYPNLLSSQYDWTAGTTKTFDLSDPLPRVPIDEGTINVSGTVTTNYDLPPEVAICLSFKATPISGYPAGRLRGRVYIGPLQSTAVDLPNTGNYNQLFSDAANEHILNPADSSNKPVWAVYSMYTHYNIPVGTRYDPDVHSPNNAFLAGAVNEVTTVWSDNAWDTQRRRGTKATARTSHVKE